MASTTVSTCTTEKVQGTHRFQIFHFSYESVGAGNFIRSGTFSVGGFNWAIIYYPHGDGEDSAGYISVYLELMSKYEEVTAFVELSLVDQNTGKPCTMFRENEVAAVLKPSSFADATWGAPKLMKRSDLDDSVYVRDDCLEIECVVTVFRELRVSETKAFCKIEVPPLDLPEHFGKMLKDTSGADVTFKVEGETFAAHRVVLAARSPVFQAQLCGHMREKRTRHISIHDMQPVVFKALLHFIYTDSLPTMDDLDRAENKQVIPHLLVAADRYGLERLKIMCERILFMNLDVENVADTLALADQHHCQKLKEACVEFMVPSERMDAVVASQGYQQLKRTCPSLLTDVWEQRSRVRRS